MTVSELVFMYAFCLVVKRKLLSVPGMPAVSARFQKVRSDRPRVRVLRDKMRNKEEAASD